jgi:hypothetical protein
MDAEWADLKSTVTAPLWRSRRRRTLLIAGGLAALVTVSVLIFSRASSHHPFFGLDVPNGNLSAVTSVAEQTGYRPTVFNIFVKLDSIHFDVGQLDAIAAAGMTPMVTLEPWTLTGHRGQADQRDYRLTSITAGKHDHSLKRLAAIIAAYHRPLYLRFAHEMNGTWYPWAAGVNDNTPDDYVTAWRYVHTLFSAAGVTQVQWVWSPNALLGSQTAATYRQLYPGDSWVDDIGLTAYGQGSSATRTIGPSLRAISSVSGKPVILSETGAAGPEKARWIQSFGPYLARHPRIVGFVWYNTTPETTGATGDYRFDSNYTTVQAFTSALRRSGVRSGHAREDRDEQ